MQPTVPSSWPGEVLIPPKPPKVVCISPLRSPVPPLLLRGLSFPSGQGFLATAAPHISTASVTAWRSRPLSLPGAEHIVSVASPARFPASDIELCAAPVLLEGPEVLPAVSAARGSGKHCKYLKNLLFFFFISHPLSLSSSVSRREV